MPNLWIHGRSTNQLTILDFSALQICPFKSQHTSQQLLPSEHMQSILFWTCDTRYLHVLFSALQDRCHKFHRLQGEKYQQQADLSALQSKMEAIL